MHIFGLVGSMRKDRHTDFLVRKVIQEVCDRHPGSTSEITHILDCQVKPCQVTCSKFCGANSYQCLHPDSAAQVIESMKSADAIVIGTPQYFRAPPSMFHTLMEKIIAIFFNHQTGSTEQIPSPVANKPCGLVAVAEYNNPHQMLEYLHDFSTLLNMNPVRLPTFPYLGVAGQGDILEDKIFLPLERCSELAASLALAIEQNKDKVQ